MSFFCNISNGFDAAIHPLSTLNDFSIEAVIFRAVLTTAVNALLNYYMGRAQMVNAGIEWEISLPENLSISDIDLCGILGNILENAVLA